jgi:hypothetical protein
MFYNVTMCRLVELYRRFGGKYCLCLKGRKVNQPNNRQDGSNKEGSGGALWVIEETWDTE